MLKRTIIIFIAGLLLITGAGCSGGSTDKKIDANNVASKTFQVIDKKFPGEWQVSGTTLKKGAYSENTRYQIVDEVSKIYPGSMVSLFVDGQRVSSTIRGRQLSDSGIPKEVAEILKTGQVSMVSGGSIGSKDYQKVYLPLKSAEKTVAVMTISIPQ